MIILKAHLRGTREPITLYLSTNFAVYAFEGTTCIVDGVHNNGGWKVEETQQDIEFEIEQWLAEENMK
jgi:hypothetical protein